MNISQLGEFALIDRFSKQFSFDQKGGFIGIGDDCAVIPKDYESSLLVSTDLLVEGVHFLKHRISAEDLGYKALTVNLSDIAAMGGTPQSIFLSLGLPADTEVSWVDQFFKGLGTLADKFGVKLLGGDTTRSLQATIVNVAIIGTALNENIKLRSAAKPGDIVCVTAELGDSAAGLKCLLQNKPETPLTKALIHAHHKPVPHVRQGEWLGAQSAVHAMMDVSDGIASDLNHILKQSQCGASIFVEKLPISESLKKASKEFSWNESALAVSGGEDYCLLFTAEKKSIESLSIAYLKEFHSPFFQIGEITSDPYEIQFFKNGQPTVVETKAFEHFPSQGKENE